MKKQWITAGIIIVLALFSYFIILHNSTINNEDSITRFVDTISKIPTIENKNRIQHMFDHSPYALITVAIDDPDHIDLVLSSLPSDEFIVLSVSKSVSAFSGNATKEAIMRLQNNPYVGDIYASGYTTTS